MSLEFSGNRSTPNHIAPIDELTEQQTYYLPMEASFCEEVVEHGGMTVEEAQQRRRELLARIGMGNYVE